MTDLMRVFDERHLDRSNVNRTAQSLSLSVL